MTNEEKEERIDKALRRRAEWHPWQGSFLGLAAVVMFAMSFISNKSAYALGRGLMTPVLGKANNKLNGISQWLRHCENREFNRWPREKEMLTLGGMWMTIAM